MKWLAYLLCLCVSASMSGSFFYHRGLVKGKFTCTIPPSTQSKCIVWDPVHSCLKFTGIDSDVDKKKQEEQEKKQKEEDFKKLRKLYYDDWERQQSPTDAHFGRGEKRL